MNSSAANVHSTRLPSEAEPGQRGPDMDSATQQLKLKERQRFFEEAFQHDVDVYLSSPHLSIRDHRRPPIGSISSMEVNVDLLDQMDMSDQEAFDVFLSSGEEGALNSPLPPVQGPSNNNGEVLNNGLFRRVLERFDGKPRMSSSSSDSSSYSQTATSNDNDRDTPVLPSDDEETRGGAAASTRAATPPETDKAKTLQSSQ